MPHAAVTFLGRLGGLLLAAGIAVTGPALWWVSGGGTRRGREATDGLLAGAGVAVQCVVLGLAVLHEHVSRRQAAGLLGAAPATVLLTIG